MSLQVNNVSVYLSSGHVLFEDINFELQAGEILAIIGPNGAGKTSLLKTLAGDLKIKQGEILYDKQKLSQWTSAKRAQQLAILPQLSSLNFSYTVEEVVGLGRTPHSTGKQCDEKIVQSILQQLDIFHLRKSLYTFLSGGEKQRSQLARVMAQISVPEGSISSKARYLFLDESTASLDLGHQQQLMQVIQAFAQQGVAIVMVMHDINLAARYVDKLLAMYDGKVLAYGSAQEVVTENLMKTLYQVDVKVIAHPETGKPVILGV